MLEIIYNGNKELHKQSGLYKVLLISEIIFEAKMDLGSTQHQFVTIFMELQLLTIVAKSSIVGVAKLVGLHFFLKKNTL